MRLVAGLAVVVGASGLIDEVTRFATGEGISTSSAIQSATWSSIWAIGGAGLLLAKRWAYVVVCLISFAAFVAGICSSSSVKPITLS
jgi:hypothetical protein